YKSLSMEEKKALIEEYACHKERKTFGLHATAKSKVNDITETLKAVENEVYLYFLRVVRTDTYLWCS
ncbi:hypothetical protein BKA83DRAFT_4055703, partial [Pisolithus microcarpus]